jgi:hypothetical protein
MMQQPEGFFQAQETVPGQCGVDALTLRLFSPDVEDFPSLIVHAFEIA